MFTGFGVARDFENGFARRLLLASPNRSGIILGYGLAALGRWAITATMLTVIALAVGMNIGGDGVDVVGLYALAVFVNMAGFLWSCGIGMRLRTIQAGPLMQMPVFLTLFFAPVYVPLELLRGWIHTVAQANPVTYILATARGFLAGDPPHVALAYGLAIAAAAVLALWAFGGLRRAEAAG